MSVMTAGRPQRPGMRAARKDAARRGVPRPDMAGGSRRRPGTGARGAAPLARQARPRLTLVPDYRERPAPVPGHRGQASRAPHRPPAGGVRLTRRGRVVVAALLVAGVVALATLIWLAAAARAEAAGAGAPSGSVYRNLTAVVVRPGQNLWSIAAASQPGADPRVVVQEIIDINALPGSAVQAGERLWVPRS